LDIAFLPGRRLSRSGFFCFFQDMRTTFSFSWTSALAPRDWFPAVVVQELRFFAPESPGLFFPLLNRVKKRPLLQRPENMVLFYLTFFLSG
jgi:hypothetical protein